MLQRYVYIMGPYMGTTTHDAAGYFQIHANIAKAHELSLQLARLGYGFFCPHTHSAHNEVIAPDLPPEYWYELDLHFLRACDAGFILPGESKGVQREIAMATAWGIPLFSTMADLLRECPPQGEAYGL